MFTISMSTLMSVQGILHSGTDDDIKKNRVVYDIRPVVKQLNKAGSFGFTVPKVNPLYSAIYRLGTMIYVYVDQELIFQGRVLDVTIDTYCNKIVTCEGVLAFLNDIVIRPYMYKTPCSLRDHLSVVMGYYNMYCDMTRGLQYKLSANGVPDFFMDSKVYAVQGITDYITVKELIDDIAGMDPAVAVSVNYDYGVPEMVFGNLPHTTLGDDSYIKLGKNVIDFSVENDADDIYTHIISVGADNISVEDGDEHYPTYHTDIATTYNYGRIDKVIRFDNATTKDDLVEVTGEFLEHCGKIDIPKLVIGAVDMKYFGVKTALIDIGTKVRIESIPHGIRAGFTGYVCTELSLDLENPDSSSYTFEALDFSEY